MNRIEQETVIGAPVERLWALLTEPEHLAAWLATGGVELDLRPGGAIVLQWDEHGRFHGLVERVEEPHVFAFRWALAADQPPREDNSTTVEFTLRADGDRTVVRVVESGFDRLDADKEQRARRVADNEQGWSAGMEALRQYVQRLAA